MQASQLITVSDVFQATPKLSEDKVRQCVDARLGGDYPPKAVAKVLSVFLYMFTHFLFCATFLAEVFCTVYGSVLLQDMNLFETYAYELAN